MKKHLTAFVILFGLSSTVPGTFISTANAQYSSSWIGVRLGANFGGQSIDSTYDNATAGLKFGILGGVQFDHWFGEMWGIGVGLLFDQKGTGEQYAQGSVLNQRTFKGSIGDSIVTYSGNDNYTLSYLEIPIVLKAAFGDGNIKPYLFAGPSIGILLSATNTTSSTGTTDAHNQPPPQITDIKSALNATDISLYFGGGILDKLDSGPALFFDAGYAAGLTKIYKTQPDMSPLLHPIGHTTSKSGDIRITIGMMWEI
jgi:hypothetical protein